MTNPQKRTASRLAGLLADERGTLALIEAQKLAIRSAPPATRRRSTGSAQDAGLRVGLWTGRTGSGVLERDPAQSEHWRRWADQDRITVAKSRPRAVLLGESMARGYFYDPFVTPSSLLEQSLAAVPGGPEVIDLAKIGLQPDELDTITRQALALEPDVLVVLAGNNWTNPQLTVADLERLADGLRDGGWHGMRAAFWDAVVLPRVRRYLNRLETIASGSAISVILAVPPYNLGDWAPEPAALVPWLPAGATSKWASAYLAALDAQNSGRHDAVLELTAEMTALDEGLTPHTAWLRAQTHEQTGDLRAAADAYAQARDNACGLLLAHTPRCPGPVIAAMRSVDHEAITVVDLVSEFANQADRPGVPGRDLFMDYCHLTFRGQQVTAARLAAAVADALGHSRAPVDDLQQADLKDEDSARAHVLAAIHCAHYGQSRPLLDHHLTTAVAISPAVAGDLADYVDFHGRRAPAWMCRSYDSFCATPAASRYLAATVPRQVDKLRDHDLRVAALAALETVDPAAAVAAADVIVAEYAGSAADLLAYRWRCRTFRERSGYSRAAERAIVECTEPVSEFDFVAGDRQDHHLTVTARSRSLPADETGPAVVEVNDTAAATLPIAATWTTHHIAVPADAMQPGINVVRVRWPHGSFAPDDALTADVHRLLRGEGPRVLAVFGELARMDMAPKPAGDRP